MPDRRQDPIDPAPTEIKPEVTVKAVRVDLPTGNGRVVLLQVPADISDSEWLVLVGRVPPIRDALRKEWKDRHKSGLAQPDELVAVRGQVPPAPRSLLDS